MLALESCELAGELGQTGGEGIASIIMGGLTSMVTAHVQGQVAKSQLKYGAQVETAKISTTGGVTKNLLWAGVAVTGLFVVAVAFLSR